MAEGIISMVNGYAMEIVSLVRDRIVEFVKLPQCRAATYSRGMSFEQTKPGGPDKILCILINRLLYYASVKEFTAHTVWAMGITTRPFIVKLAAGWQYDARTLPVLVVTHLERTVIRQSHQLH